MCDRPSDYTARGFTDIWKGEYHGKAVCVKVIRAQQLTCLREVEGVWPPFYSIGDVLSLLHTKIYRRVVEESKFKSHPNVLPIIRVSEELFPFCCMSPWMPDGNITQYTQANPDADRLILVRAHRLEDWWGLLTDHVCNSSHKRAAASYTFTGWAFYTVASVR